MGFSADVIKARIKVRSSCIRVGPKSSDSVLMRERRGDLIHREEFCVKAGVEIQPQDKGCLELEEVRKGQRPIH